jgi:hypothetical protein
MFAFALAFTEHRECFTQAQGSRFVKLTTQLHLLQKPSFHSSVARQSDSRSFELYVKKAGDGRWRGLNGDIKVRLSLRLIVHHNLQAHGVCKYNAM